MKEFETIAEKRIRVSCLIKHLNYSSEIRILNENQETLFIGCVYRLFDNHDFDRYTLFDIDFLSSSSILVTVKEPRT